MRQFLNVFRFELSQIFKQKSFYISMFLTVAIVFGLSFISRFMGGETEPEISSEISEEEITENGDDLYKEKIALLINGKVDESTLKELNSFYNIEEVKDQESINKLLNDEEIDMGVILLSDIEAKVVVKDQGMYDYGSSDLAKILEDNYKYSIALAEEGISRESYDKIDSIRAQIDIEDIGKNPFIGYALSYAALVFLYFTILLHGNGVATDVAKEKDSRTMEILITNVKPKFLIWGKVLARTVATLVQLLALVFAIYAGIKVNGSSSQMIIETVQTLFSTVKATDLILLMIFALTGVIMYYFLFASFGSLVNKVDQLPQTLSPVTMLIVAAFMIPMFTMTNPSSIVMKVVSFVPFTSPLAIFPRYLMTSMSIVEVLISYAILVLTTLIMAWLSIRIYRHGTLNYGNKLNVWKLLTSKH